MNPNEELIKIYEKEIDELNKFIIELQKSLANKTEQAHRLTQGKDSFQNKTMLVNDFEFQPRRECLIFKTPLHIAPDSTAEEAIKDAEKQKKYYVTLAEEIYGSKFDEEGTVEILSVFPSKKSKTKEIIGWNAKVQYNFPNEDEDAAVQPQDGLKQFKYNFGKGSGLYYTTFLDCQNVTTIEARDYALQNRKKLASEFLSAEFGDINSHDIELNDLKKDKNGFWFADWYFNIGGNNTKTNWNACTINGNKYKPTGEE